ncbi:MAG: A24 family peptidase [Gemmatimonadales bacterium]
MTLFGIVSAALTLLLAAAAWADYRSRRIPNALTVSGLAVALLLRAVVGPDAIIEGLVGALLAFVLTLPLLILGVMGGGDAKLLIAIGAFMGPRHFLWAAVLIAIIGGMMAVVDAGRRGALLPVLFNCGQILKHWFTFGRRGANRSFASVGAMTIPYGVAIAAGALLWWFAQVQRL